MDPKLIRKLPKLTLGQLFLGNLVLYYMLGTVAALTWTVFFFATVYLRATQRPKPTPANVGKRVDVHRDPFSPQKVPKDLDAIVIGSGVGGLYAAAFLSKLGKRVLVLEQHYIAGGTTHTFDLNGFEFDTGVHYINNYKVAEKILEPVQAQPVQFRVMGSEADGYTHDKICLGENYTFTCRKHTVFADMAKEFPADAKGIKRIRQMINESQIVLGLDLLCKTLPKFIWRIVKEFIIPGSWWRHIERGGNELVHEYVRDKKLQGILLGRYGDMGGPPDQVAMCLHAAIAESFAQDGGAFPVGGPTAFAKALIPTIEASGGRVLVRAPVERVLLANYDDAKARAACDYDPKDELDNVELNAASNPENYVQFCSGADPSEYDSTLYEDLWNMIPAPIRDAIDRYVPSCISPKPKVHAVGVRVKGMNIYAPLIISNAGAWNTYARLLPRPLVKPLGYLEQMRTAQPSVSHIYAFIGLKGDQAELKLPDCNFWCIECDAPDYDVHKAATKYFEDPLNGPLCFFYGFPSAKDPDYSKRNPGKSVCLCFAETSLATAFSEWKNSTPSKRESDYLEYKELVGQRLLEGFKKRNPHLVDRIEVVEYATPLTNMNYLNSAHGESLGIRCNPYRLSSSHMHFMRPATDVEGLFMTGQDAAIPGVFGAMLGGLLCSQVVSDLSDVVANPGFFAKLPKTYIDMMSHFVASKKAVV